MHGNLRHENILILLDRKQEYIEKVFFIGLEYLSNID